MGSLFDVYDALARSGLFDPDYYRARHPEAASSNLDPLVHYIEHGARQGLVPHPEFDPAYYLEQCARAGERPANPLLHYLTVGAKRGLERVRAAQHGTSVVDAERMLFVDAPNLKQAPAPIEVRAGLTIVGWTLARRGIASVGIAIDGVPLLAAHYGTPRADVAAAYPDWDGALNSGFAATIPRRSIAPGLHTVGVTATGHEIFTLSPKGWHRPPYGA